MAGNGLLSNLSVQTLLPEDYENQAWFARQLSVLRECGFSGVELNIVDVEKVQAEILKRFLDTFGLRLTAYASGAAAKARGLSLSHERESDRRSAVEACKRFLAFAAPFDASVIVGFLKGGPDAESHRLTTSLKALAPLAEGLGVDLIIEATNRYESGACTTIAQTLAVIDAVGSERIKVLPDTFHMNIEETDMLAALDLSLNRCVSVHLSDNNRLLPGHGALDFGSILRHLDHRGFDGVIALEGNIRVSFEDDVRLAAEHLSDLAGKR
jgi:sugar phosphate isomerase/epimerase